MKKNWSRTVIGLVLIACVRCSDNPSSPIVPEPKPLPKCGVNIFPTDGWYVLENSTIRLSWTPSTGASVYDVYLAEGENTPTRIGSNLTETHYDYEVPPGIDITYTWYVNYKNAGGDSANCPQKQTSFITKNQFPSDEVQKTVNVLVLNYNPVMANSSTVTEFYNWNNPHVLASEYMNDVLTSSHNLIKYNIVEWRDLNEFPVKADGFTYTESEYKACIQNQGKCHASDKVNYYKIIVDQKIEAGINDNTFEEVWLFGGPYFGFWESSMAGSKAFYISGGVFQEIGTDKAFAIMGFNYERGSEEMMHDLCHRTEATMSFVSGGWRTDVLTTAWARYAANITQTKGVAGVGSCHFPPNALRDYDYANPNFVSSSASDYYNYPLLNGFKEPVNSETWGGPILSEPILTGGSITFHIVQALDLIKT
jgi:hypothetical protein